MMVSFNSVCLMILILCYGPSDGVRLKTKALLLLGYCCKFPFIHVYMWACKSFVIQTLFIRQPLLLVTSYVIVLCSNCWCHMSVSVLKYSIQKPFSCTKIHCGPAEVF